VQVSADRDRRKTLPGKALAAEAISFAAGVIGSDINDGDDGPINFILQRPVGKDFELMMNAHTVCKLSFERVKIRNDLQNHRLQIGNLDGGIDIRKRTANVAGN